MRSGYKPRKRKSIRLRTALFQKGNILMSPMIRVASNLPRPTTSNLAGDFAKSVPDRRASAVFIHGTFNLIRSRREAPKEIGGKSGLLNGSHGDDFEIYTG
jgi:hypothetical protein